MFNINDNQNKSQLNNFWNYLDELAEKNPEEYQKFISQQMKRGMENIKEEKEDKILKVNTFLCLRFKLLSFNKNEPEHPQKNKNIQIHENNKNEISEVPKILFSYDFQSNAFKGNILEDPKVYLNIVTSNQFRGPTDDKGNPLSEKDAKDDTKWGYIPTQFRYNGKKNSMSGKRCDFYDVIVSSLVIDRITTNEELKSSILAYMVRKFCIFSEQKYKVFTDNVKIVKNKKYKSLKMIPEEFKIVAKEGENVIKNDINEAEVLNKLTEPSQSTPAKNLYDEIKIPNKSENFPNTETFYNLPKNAPKGGEKKAPPKVVSKKILIEEIKQKSEIKITKTILSGKEMEVSFDFSPFEEITMDKIDLQISQNTIKLKLENTKYIEQEDYDPIEMNFNFLVDVDNCTAKFNKNENKLKLILLRK